MAKAQNELRVLQSEYNEAKNAENEWMRWFDLNKFENHHFECTEDGYPVEYEVLCAAKKSIAKKLTEWAFAYMEITTGRLSSSYVRRAIRALNEEYLNDETTRSFIIYHVAELTAKLWSNENPQHFK